MKKGLIFLTIISAVFLLFTAKTSMANTTADYQTIFVAEDEVIEDNFFRFGNEVIINGDVRGDVIVGANTLVINGRVSGDVLAAASSIEINGEVEGNVRVAAADVRINNKVGKNVNIAANTAKISKEASIGWTLSFALNSLNVEGPIGGNIYGFGNSISLNDYVGNNVTLQLGEEGLATVRSGTNIGGNFKYTGNKNAVIESDAVIKGDTVHKLLPQSVAKAKGFLNASWWLVRLISLFALLLVGTILVSFFKHKVIKVTETIWNKPSITILWGIVYIIVIPLAILILFFTIIGIPLALIASALYLILLYLAKIFIGTLIGRKILSAGKGGEKQEVPIIWSMMLGTFIVFILASLPYLGFFVSLITSVWFLGAIWRIIQLNKNRVQK